MEDLINGIISLDDYKNQLGYNDNSKETLYYEPVDSEDNTITVESPKEEKPQQQYEIKPTKNDQQPTIHEQNPAEQEEKKPVSQEQHKPTAQELLDAAVKELYAYEAELLSRLGEMKREALKEYYARGATHDNLIAVGMEGLDKCYEIESEADIKVRAVLDKLKKDLEGIGADTKITKELWEYYCDEKENTKSYYLNKYL